MGTKWQAVKKFREEVKEVITDQRFVVPTDLDKVKSASKLGILATPQKL